MRDKIIFLDAGTVDYGDLSFEPIEKLGPLTLLNFTPASEIPNRLKGAAVVITNKGIFSAETIKRLETVSSIHLTATGVNNVDLQAARQKGIAVTNVPGYSTESVVQSTFAFLLALAGNLVKFNESVHSGKWSRSPFFCMGAFPIIEIAGKNLGIVGYGAIGKRVAEIARAFGMKPLIAKIPGRKYVRESKIKRVEFGSVVRESDFLTIHAPLTDLTRDLINHEVIRKMKPGAFLINMARGGIVNEPALRRALEQGKLAGAACDVLSAEPPPRDHVLLGAPNLLLTPHIAWASLEARKRLVDEVAANIAAFQKGKQRNRIV